MNIETANRLLAYRKQFGYSQEQLAERLGLSRQAISKWERAEASPDTDNLIELAKLYGVTLDELIMGTETDVPPVEKTVPAPTEEVEVKADETQDCDDDDEDDDDDDDDEKNGESPSGIKGWLSAFPTGVLAVVIYLILGFAFGAWHPGWLVFLMIPVVDSIFSCIRRRSLRPFAYPVLCAFAYLVLGFFVSGGWAWGWIVFLTIPLWDWVISLF